MKIASFSEKRVALALSDYLRSIDIANTVQADGAEFAVMVAHESHAAAAQAEAQLFIENITDKKYWQASWATGRVQKEAVYEKSSIKMGAQWWRNAGWVTRSVAILCGLIFAALMWNFSVVFSALNYPQGIRASAIHGQWWRLLTPAFIHFSAMHIIFNVLWWWELGGLVERAQSGARLLVVMLVIALVSNAAQFLDYGANFGGLSGVIYGLLGYLLVYPFADPSAPFRLRTSIVLFMVGWLALGYTGIFDAIFGPVSNVGHLSGLLAGVVLGLLFGVVNRKPLPAAEEQ